MKYLVNFLIFNRHGNIFLQQSKRYAGHSKWQNIRHIKQEKDAEKQQIFMNFRKRMKVAIAEGGSAKLSENSQLASLVEQAKKANMPVNSINTFLEKMSKRNGQSFLLEMRTVGGAIMILHVSTDNLVQVKSDLNNKIKKLRCQFIPPTKMIFDCGRYITTKKDCSLDEAMNDAINVGAEDVEEIKENDDTYFKFKCSLEVAIKIPTQLKSLNYTIIEMETTCVAKNLVELDESDLEEINAIKKKLLEIESIEKIEDNIA